VTFTLRFTNVQQPDPASHRLDTIATTARGADVIAFNEANKDHGAITALQAFDEYIVNELALAWRLDKFTLIDKGNRLVGRGGRLGAEGSGTRDDRRRGPNRYVAWVVLRELATAREVLIATHHAIARADTVAKWRRPLRRSAFRNTGTELQRAARRNPSVVGMLIVGDLNTIGAVNYPGPREVEVNTPATYGRRLRYDRIHREGEVAVSGVRVFKTRSDHKGLEADITLGGVPTPAPPPPKEEPMPRGLCPFAKHRIIPPGSNDPTIKPRVAILHVDAGDNPSLFEFFRDRSGGIESHFHIAKTGTIEQYRDIYHQADANRDANDFAVSIETQGFGAGEWNDAQLASIKRLLVWLNTEAGIPLRQVERWDGSGVGYHTLFGAPSHWTPVAKSCPGPDRKRQFHNVIVPWMKEASVPEPKLNNVESIRAGVLALLNTHGPKIPKSRRVARAWVASLRVLAKRGPKS
jgi:N-acetylmuramoyl-L-alanine amidase